MTIHITQSDFDNLNAETDRLRLVAITPELRAKLADQAKESEHAEQIKAQSVEYAIWVEAYYRHPTKGITTYRSQYDGEAYKTLSEALDAAERVYAEQGGLGHHGLPNDVLLNVCHIAGDGDTAPIYKRDELIHVLDDRRLSAALRAEEERRNACRGRL